jgi:integrase
LSLHSRGWEETLALYKPQPELIKVKPDHSTVGDLIREVSASTSYRITTFYDYCASLRRIAAGLLHIKGDKKRYAAKGTGNRKWREQVDAAPLDVFTTEAVQEWKLQYINAHKDCPEAHSRAVNTVNAHIRNARSLFTEKALEFAKERLALLCGLRKREIDTLMWSSVDFEKQVIRIERTRYFQPKSEESATEVDLASELVAIFRVYRESAKSEFVIESENAPRYHISRANYRAERNFKALYAWLESKGVSARKKLHELRKECGSVIAIAWGSSPPPAPFGILTSASPRNTTPTKRFVLRRGWMASSIPIIPLSITIQDQPAGSSYSGPHLLLA